MRAFVTGGAGFVGSHYVRGLLGGAQSSTPVEAVTVFDKLTYAGNLANLEAVAGDSRLRFVQGDLIDCRSLDELLPGHDVVVHFAAESHVDRSISGPADFVVTNVLGAQTLFEACLRAGIRRVVSVSTDEVYGSVPDRASREGDRLAPSSPYSAAKAAADLLAGAYACTHGLPVVVTRAANTYGPYQFPEKIVPLFVTNLLDGRPVPLYGDGQHSRDWLHVDDHCRAVQVALESGEPGQIYNVAGTQHLTNAELTNRLLAACGTRWEGNVEAVADRKGHDRRYRLDDTKLRALGYQPAVDFDAGLTDTVRWYREHRGWWEPLKAKAGV